MRFDDRSFPESRGKRIRAFLPVPGANWGGDLDRRSPIMPQSRLGSALLSNARLHLDRTCPHALLANMVAVTKGRLGIVARAALVTVLQQVPIASVPLPHTESGVACRATTAWRSRTWIAHLVVSLTQL